MANPTKSGPAPAEVIEDMDLSPRRPVAVSETSPTGRFITIDEMTFPVAFSKRNPSTGQIFDYVARTKEVEARVHNPATGVMERKVQLVTIHRKYARKGTSPTGRPVELVDYDG